MSIASYGLLKGKAALTQIETKDKAPHFQILVLDESETRWRVPVNVESSEGSEVLYYLDREFEHPLLDKLEALPSGFTPKDPNTHFPALDFQRDHLFDPQWMEVLPSWMPGDGNDLQDILENLVQPFAKGRKGTLYAFGASWDNTTSGRRTPLDKTWGTYRGVHEIHMNQGNDPKSQWGKDNGTWQDGSLLIHDEAAKRWYALFIAFQTQSWATDDHGNPTEGPNRVDPGLQIIGAMVKPKDGQPETITLFNGSDEDVNLKGWALDDHQNRKELLGAKKIASGESYVVNLSGNGLKLPDNGGVIRLLDPTGRVADAERYTKAMAKRRGRLITFG